LTLKPVAGDIGQAAFEGLVQVLLILFHGKFGVAGPASQINGLSGAANFHRPPASQALLLFHGGHFPFRSTNHLC
jgi:hypothetical protein